MLFVHGLGHCRRLLDVPKRRASVVGCIVAALFLARALLWVEQTDFRKLIGDPQLFATADGKEYLAISTWLGGSAPMPSIKLLALRPLGYPSFLTIQAIVGSSGIAMIQLALFTAALGVAARCTALLAPTPVFLCWRALTEPLCLALSLVLIALVARGSECLRSRGLFF